MLERRAHCARQTRRPASSSAPVAPLRLQCGLTAQCACRADAALSAAPPPRRHRPPASAPARHITRRRQTFPAAAIATVQQVPDALTEPQAGLLPTRRPATERHRPTMRVLLALLLAALLLLGAPAGAAAKPKACKRYRMNADSYVSGIVPKCMPDFSLTCSGACRKHLRKVGGRSRWQGLACACGEPAARAGGCCLGMAQAGRLRWCCPPVDHRLAAQPPCCQRTAPPHARHRPTCRPTRSTSSASALSSRSACRSAWPAPCASTRAAPSREAAQRRQRRGPATCVPPLPLRPLVTPPLTGPPGFLHRCSRGCAVTL